MLLSGNKREGPRPKRYITLCSGVAMKKKGYYFTVDALLAVAVLVLGIILVLFGFASDPVETPQFILADDVLRVLATTEASPGVTYFQQIGEC
jgi:hypothetical protein